MALLAWPSVCETVVIRSQTFYETARSYHVASTFPLLNEPRKRTSLHEISPYVPKIKIELTSMHIRFVVIKLRNDSRGDEKEFICRFTHRPYQRNPVMNMSSRIGIKGCSPGGIRSAQGPLQRQQTLRVT